MRALTCLLCWISSYSFGYFLPIVRTEWTRGGKFAKVADELDMSTVSVDKAYDADAITVLTGLEPVRKRPGMYIGSTGSKGLHHLVFEVVDNSVDECLAGFADIVNITIHTDNSIEVSDNGRGIPCSLHPTTGKSSLETVLCVLHAGGKFGGDESGYKVSGGLHGVGISVVNALSDNLQVTVVRDGFHHSMEFSRGIAVGEMIRRPALDHETRGTRVHFHPDAEIFKTTVEFEQERLASRIDELAYLNAGLTLRLTDLRTLDQKSQIFRHDGGISELCDHLCRDKTSIYPSLPVISVRSQKNGIWVEAALSWASDSYSELIVGFANGIRTPDGGTHVDGLKAAVTKTVNAAAKRGKDSVSIPAEFIREGLTAVVAVKLPDAEFEGQTKSRLGTVQARQAVDQAITETLSSILDFHPTLATAIVNKATQAMAAAQAARAARDMIRRKSLLTTTVLPGKLADCASRDMAETEIYVVEGDSAAGSAKQGRDRRFQAILPLKGKILNIERASNEKIYGNSEIQALIAALGLGIRGTEFDKSTLRYGKIILMTDADVDGAHIRLLLLTFLYRYCRQLLTEDGGRVYIACPPLYKVTVAGKKSAGPVYLYDQSAYDQHISALKKQGITGNSITTQRFKGLGEMMPQQLWETTMDPARRSLKLVAVEDAAAADRLFSALMGDNVAPRKEFILANAERLKLSDLDY